LTAFLDKLPTILILGVLVGIFLSLRRHAPSARIRMWTCAWALIFLHFFIQGFETRTGATELVFEWIDLAALELSGIVFVVAMSRIADDPRKRFGILALLGIHTAIHALAATFNWPLPWVLLGCLALVFFGGSLLALSIYARGPVLTIGIVTALTGSGIWAIHDQLRGSPDLGITAILTISFGLCGILFWKRYPRLSPGVIAVSGGFLAWGAVFPAATLLAKYYPKLAMNPELWNVPKFFVAFGMVLTLIEDKSSIIEQASAREHAENLLLQRLSHVTSRLLAGKDPAALCSEIAVAVTDASTFNQAALFLVSDGGSLRLAGSDGLSPEEIANLEEETTHWTIEKIKEICSGASRIGNHSFCPNGAREVLIPLESWRGSQVGCLRLSGPRNQAECATSEMVMLEVLASDLAVTIENSQLHHQLVRSEKLAALGQLVAGVAHELNNPLTGIIGYADLLSDEIEKETAVKRVQKLGHEARRMKRIVDGLLRFARQNNPAARAADFEAALRDVVQLREYHLRKLGIDVQVDVEPLLPRLAIGEDELKQVLLNVLNNAIDAIAESAKRSIRISARHQAERVTIRFEDSGPGFAEPNRAFDPFYTTKPVGKGTGLGLSICYGIAQECGGNIALSNKQPYGASIVLDLPVSTQPIAPLLSPGI
jgi:signal transduction histidine kinase